MKKKSLVIISFVFIFLFSGFVLSASDNQDGKISFGEWLKGLWGKITGQQILQPLQPPQIACPADGDGDGYIIPTRGCPSPYDCNDANALIKPGATEICGNNIDEDCSGADLVCEVCNPVWTKTEAVCSTGDIFIAYYLNQTACIDSRPENETYNCDYNKNNLICESFPKIESVGMYDGFLLDPLKNYTKPKTGPGMELIQLAQGGGGGADFNWNFSAGATPLDFCNISIEVADSASDNFGYTIIKNVSAKNKTVWVERLNKTSGAVCIKDVLGEILISDFSSKCNGNDEVLVSCPSGIGSAYKCEVVLDAPPSTLSWFKVWPLNHSAVKEMTVLRIGSLLVGNVCQENWNCTNWTDITETGEGCGARICNDLNNCGTFLDKPLESLPCVQEEECNPSWVCKDFGKCVDGFKERICTDSNNCGIETNKPSETQECKKGFSPLVIALAVVGLLLIIFLIIYFMKRKKSGEEEPSETQATYQAPTSPSSPSAPTNVYTPRPQYAQQHIQR